MTEENRLNVVVGNFGTKRRAKFRVTLYINLVLIGLQGRNTQGKDAGSKFTNTTIEMVLLQVLKQDVDIDFPSKYMCHWAYESKWVPCLS